MALVLHGESRFAEPGPLPAGQVASALLSILTGAALLTGLFTAAASVAATLLSTIEALPFVVGPPADASPRTPLFLLLLLVSVAIALLGPGAFSIDSYRFGRREIVIPGDTPSRRR